MGVTRSHTLIFIPSYFDFVRVRNLFREVAKDEELRYKSCSEYTPAKEVLRVRGAFHRGEVDFLLCTERFHFFNRYRLKGIHNIIFYSPPQYPQFYSELINLIENRNNAASSCVLLFSAIESLYLERILGTRRCRQLIRSAKSTHLFISS